VGVTLALLPQYEKEAMGVIVGVGGLAAFAALARSRRFLVGAGTAVAGVAIAVASFVVNVEDNTYWGTFRDKAVFALWCAVVVLIATLVVRRSRGQSRERRGGPNSRSAHAGQ
jgi:predicted naringenin-chalcone synthase